MKIVWLTAICLILPLTISAQETVQIVPPAVEQQAARLKSDDAETRRDAIAKLRLLQSAFAARAAAQDLNDRADINRASVAEAVVFLADEDVAALLTPLLGKGEKSEFVRREAAFALGAAHSRAAVPALIKALQTDKMPSVRAAAAIALGQIADERGVDPLAQILLLPATKKNRKIVDEFVRRSAARALGEIRLRTAVPALIAALQNRENPADVRREAAAALGLIADKSAINALEENVNAEDYLLAQIARDALRRIADSKIIVER